MRIQETTVLRTVVIDAPIEVVWRELHAHGLEELQLLMSHEGNELREGGKLEWFDREAPGEQPRIKGRVAVISAPRRIVFTTYMPATGVPDEPQNYTTVDITLQAADDGRTLVSVDHGDFASLPHGPRHAKRAGDHWVEMLIRLKNAVERGAAA